MRGHNRFFTSTLLIAVLGPVLASGCDRKGNFAPVDMWNRSRLKPYEQVAFFDNNMSSRPLPPGTVARGHLRTNEALYEGTLNGQYVTAYPFPIDKEVLKRGQERYNIYCAPCHGITGNGDGVIVKRGLSAPPSYHIERLRAAPVGHFYNVITHGYGAMYSYQSRVPVNDRWAISAYIRVLQRSQRATAADVPADQREKVKTFADVERDRREQLKFRAQPHGTYTPESAVGSQSAAAQSQLPGAGSQTQVEPLHSTGRNPGMAGSSAPVSPSSNQPPQAPQ